ncbi:hypothetical protein [Brevundimonas bullata]|uniref:hypothetical protein n=1 Tax=Brevundimonas bullata TaxID=13160 RepID=UPI003D9A951A
MARETKSLAMENGHVCFRAGLPIKDSNPYPKASRSHALFEQGYRRAETKALSPDAPAEGGS